MYKIKVAAELSGVPITTIRSWERRHGGFLTPSRCRNGFRTYSNEDVKKLRLGMILTRQGHQLKNLAPLSLGELEKLAEDAVPLSATALVHDVVRAIRRHNFDRVDRLLWQGALCVRADSLLKAIIPALTSEVGKLWDYDDTTGPEKVVSLTIVQVLTWLLDQVPVALRAPILLRATPGARPSCMCTPIPDAFETDPYEIPIALPAFREEIRERLSATSHSREDG